MARLRALAINADMFCAARLTFWLDKSSLTVGNAIAANNINSGGKVLHAHGWEPNVNPFTGAEYIAVKGGGAIFNDRRCRVTAHRNLEGALFATDASNQLTQSSRDRLFSDLLTDLGQAGVQTRISGCPTLDLAQVASGQLDAALLTNIKTQDLEAALLICAEAGALVGSLKDGLIKSGEKTLVAANPKLFKTTLQRFSSYGSKLTAE